MTKQHRNQSGFTVIEALIILVVIIAIAGVGWLVYKNNHKTTNESASASSTTQTASAPKLNNPNQPAKPADPYAGWKTYTLTYEKLTFMYPPGWQVSDQSRARHDIVIFNAPGGFSLWVNDGIQNGGDPLALFYSEPISTHFIGKQAYILFGKPPDKNDVAYAVLLTQPHNQASFPADKNVIGSIKYNGVNGPEGAYMLISMGYDGKNNMPLASAKSDPGYKNGELIVKSAHY